MTASYDFLSFSFSLGLSLAIFISFALSSVWFFFMLRVQNKNHKKELDQLSKKMNAVTSASVGMGQRLIELECNLANLRDAQDEFKHKDLDFSYGQAHKLINEGLSNDAVAANSGLSVSEVSLMELMHQESKSSERTDSLRADGNIKEPVKTAKSFRSSGLLESV